MMRRWVKVAIAVGVTLVVLVGAAEIALRMIIPNVVDRELREQLDLPRQHPIDIELGGSTVLHALGGGVGDITVDIPDAPVMEGLTASLTLTADRVPFSVTSGDLSGAEASVFVSSDELGPVISMLTSGVADTGRTSSGMLVVGREISAFGFTVPIEGRLQLSTVDGQVRIEPKGLSAVGFDLAAEQLAASTGGLLDPLLSPHILCIDDQIPAGLTLKDIYVGVTGVRVSVALAPDFLSNPEQQQPGVCEGERLK